jgi:(2Fe-2S) ferredoxin
VTVVVYPEGVWYGGVRTEDVQAIVDEHLIGGRPVERLRIPDDELTGKPLGPEAVGERTGEHTGERP